MPRNFVVVATVLLLAGCSTLSVQLPPVTDVPTNNRLAGKVIWHDLLTSDIAASQAFYAGLFGWEFEAVPLTLGLGRRGEYVMIRSGGRLIGGMLDVSRVQGEVNSSQWVVVMSVSDLDGALGAVRANAGEVLTPATDLADRGRIAVVKDSTGALFALLETRTGDPLDDEPRNGEFLWNEVWTDDIDQAAAFYEALAPFARVTRETPQGRYVGLTLGGKPRFGLLTQPVDGLRPTWAAYIKVADMSLLDRVEALGGTVVIPSQPRDLGGEVAVIQGPSGAGIALQTWPAS